MWHAANYFTNNGSWDGVDAVLNSRYQAIQEEVTGRSLLLTAPDGRVIASSDGQQKGRRLPREALSEGVPITVNDRKVGILLIGPVVDNFSPREAEFLQAVQHLLMFVGLIGLVIAVVTGLILRRQLLAPLRALTRAAQGIRAGRLEQQVHVPGLGQDELGELARTFNDMAAHLKRSEEIRRNMITDISHELRTPLAALQCNLEAMLAGVEDPQKQNLEALYNQTLLLGRLVEDLRELQLAESGELPLKKASMDLSGVLRRIAQIVRPQLVERGIEFVLEVPEALPPVEVDGERIEQVIYNLLSNAQRYTPTGGRVRLAARPQDGHLALLVSDTGCGVPPEELPFIFDRFYRADRSRSRATGGAGLGLAIAKQLVTAHHGSIEAKSQHGSGTTFEVLLPLATTDSQGRRSLDKARNPSDARSFGSLRPREAGPDPLAAEGP